MKVWSGLQKIRRNLFRKHLLLTNIGIGCAFGLIGDKIQQNIQAGQTSDHKRSAIFSVSTIPVSASLHFWYKWLDRKFVYKSGGRHSILVKKLLLDECIMAPANFIMHMTGVTLLEGNGLKEVHRRLSHGLVLMVLVDLCIFGPVQYCNFRFLPSKYRILALYSASIFYYIVESFALYEFSHVKSN